MPIAHHLMIATLGLALGATAALAPGCSRERGAAHSESTAAVAPAALAAHDEAARIEAEIAAAWQARTAAAEANPRDPDQLTILEQEEDEVDLTITHEIQNELAEHQALSSHAPQLAIRTEDGVVTLRGPVRSDVEKREALAVVQRVNGVRRVDNQLRVAAVD